MKALAKSLLYLCLLISIYSTGQNTPNNSLFDYVKNTPKSVEANLKTLANYLKAPTQNDREVVEVIYYWIALNIKYDLNAYLSGDYFNNIDASNTLLNKSSACQGYTTLFAQLCKLSKIKCEVIEGYSTGYGFSGNSLEEPNHAWNAVRIDKKWELVDVTWGSGYVRHEGDKLTFVQSFNGDYLFPDPSDFIVEHLPVKENWQLLDEPISAEEFFSDFYQIKRMGNAFK